MKKVTRSHREKAGRIKDKKKVAKSGRSVTRDQSGISGDTPKKNRPGTFVKGDPRINRTKPGPGRPRGKFARKCRKVLNGPKTWRAVRRTLHNSKSPHFKGMWSEVSNRAYGRQNAGLSIGVGNGDGDPENVEPVNALGILIVKLDQMEERTKKARAHLKESA